VLGDELWEVDIGTGSGGDIHDCATRRGTAAVEHDPIAQAEAGIHPIARAWVVGAVASGLARGPEAEVLSDVEGEQSASDVHGDIGW
jgi:hypothetical protein